MSATKWIALGAGFSLLLIVVLLSRSIRGAPASHSVSITRKPPNKASYYVPPKTPIPPAPSKEVEKAADEARVKSTFQNYRTAIATGNRRLQDSLHDVLIRDRALAVRVAEIEVASSMNSSDREITQRALEGIRQ
jgi:hypothetical protein